MRHTLFIFGIVSAVVLAAGIAPSMAAPKADEAGQPPSLVGGQRDEQGCLTGAGYSWCEQKHICLRVWERPCDAQPQQVVARIISARPDAGRSIITTDITNGAATTTDYILDAAASINLSAIRSGKAPQPVTAATFPQWFLSATSTNAHATFTLTLEGHTVTALVAH